MVKKSNLSLFDIKQVCQIFPDIWESRRENQIAKSFLRQIIYVFYNQRFKENTEYFFQNSPALIGLSFYKDHFAVIF